MIQLPTILPVTSHTDFVGPGSTFVAIQGLKQNGVDYIPRALQQGATTIVISQDYHISYQLSSLIAHYKAQIIFVANARKALAELSAQAFGYPAKQLKIIGITGTKGKTTTAFLIEHILTHAGYKTALLSTVYNKILDQKFSTQLTTQHPDYLHMFFDQCVKKNIDYVVMETAAQAHNLYRTHALEFSGFVFTNFSQEHGEFYHDINDYFEAKKALTLQNKANSPLILNVDNNWTPKILNKKALLIGKKGTPDYSFSDIQVAGIRSHYKVYHSNQMYEIQSPLLGNFNAYNTTMAFALCHQLGVPGSLIQSILQETTLEVPGRLEHYRLPNNALCIIDFAHNPSSYESVLSLLATLTSDLIVVFGAGGDRDKTKRPLMGALAAQYAHHIVLTSDNPRSEDPQTIINDILAGIAPSHLHKVIVEPDREKAIKKAYTLSRAKSILALLGKGADYYQIINGQKYYFNEKEIVQNLSSQ